MLDKSKMVEFVLTTDYERAREFHGGKLGFEFVSLDQFAPVMRAGGHIVRIGKMPDFKPLQNSILGWKWKTLKRRRNG